MRRHSFLIAMSVIFVTTLGQQAAADIFNLNFQGNAGFGLLPGNENPPVNSTAFGGETGGGLVYNDTTNLLSIEFSFSDLTGGLFNAADGGIHIHDAGPTDPFDNNGLVEINLNSGFANVPQGSTSGSIDLDLTLTDAQEIELLNGQYYVNIHSGGFNGGELRGNLVVPEPSTTLFLGAAVLGLVLRRKR